MTLDGFEHAEWKSRPFGHPAGPCCWPREAGSFDRLLSPCASALPSTPTTSGFYLVAR